MRIAALGFGIVLALAACSSSSDTGTGDATGGDAAVETAGDGVTGDAATGDVPAGDTKTDAPAADVPAGDTPAGDAATGDVPASDAAAGGGSCTKTNAGTIIFCEYTWADNPNLGVAKSTCSSPDVWADGDQCENAAGVLGDCEDPSIKKTTYCFAQPGQTKDIALQGCKAGCGKNTFTQY